MTPNQQYEDSLIFEQFCSYLATTFGITLLDAREDPHVLCFIEHCVERPTIRGRGYIQRPIRAKLRRRIAVLNTMLRENQAPFVLTSASLAYAKELQRAYATPDRGTIAATPSDVVTLTTSLDESNPRELRLKSCILLLWATWARPGEVLRCHYPADINAAFQQGIVLTIRRSKTSIEPEYIPVEHEPNQQYCAVCTLRRWLDWFGNDYQGPLFPSLPHGRPGNATTTAQLHKALQHAQQGLQLPRRLTPYSFRKGPATTAAASAWNLETIQQRLRHRCFTTSLSYIDRRVLLTLMTQTLD